MTENACVYRWLGGDLACSVALGLLAFPIALPLSAWTGTNGQRRVEVLKKISTLGRRLSDVNDPVYLVVDCWLTGKEDPWFWCSSISSLCILYMQRKRKKPTRRCYSIEVPILLVSFNSIYMFLWNIADHSETPRVTHQFLDQQTARYSPSL